MSPAQWAVWITALSGAGALLISAPEINAGTVAYVAGLLLLTGGFSLALARSDRTVTAKGQNSALLMLCRERWRESQGADANAMRHFLPLPLAEVEQFFAARNKPVPDDWEIIVGNLPH